MPVSKADAGILERTLEEHGYSRLNIAIGARALVLSASEDGVQRDRARFVAMPKGIWRVEVAENGRWKDARISALLQPAVVRLAQSGALGPPEKLVIPETTDFDEREARLQLLRESAQRSAALRKPKR